MNIFDRYYKRYDAWYDENIFAYLSELEAIREVLPERGKGLEIGVGTGRFAAPLGIATGIDPAKNMIELARQRGVAARVARGEHLPFRDDVFDHVAVIITLCFVKNPKKVLEEARRVLKKNGKIIIGIIDKDSFLGKFYRRGKSVFYKQANFFSVGEVKNLLRKAGFNKYTYRQTIFRMPQEMTLLQRPRQGFGQGAFAVISAQKS